MISCDYGTSAGYCVCVWLLCLVCLVGYDGEWRDMWSDLEQFVSLIAGHCGPTMGHQYLVAQHRPFGGPVLLIRTNEGIPHS